MRYKSTLLALGTLSLATAAFASNSASNVNSDNAAQHYFYAGAEVGGDFPSEADARAYDFGQGALIGLYAGYRFNEYVRTDVSYDYTQNEAKNGTEVHKLAGNDDYSMFHNQQFVLANAYFNLNYLNNRLQPYVGAGVGYGQKKISSDSSPHWAPNGSVSSVAIQVSAGLNYNVIQNFGMGVGYKFMATYGNKNITKFGNFNENNIYNNTVLATLFYNFR